MINKGNEEYTEANIYNLYMSPFLEKLSKSSPLDKQLEKKDGNKDGMMGLN